MKKILLSIMVLASASAFSQITFIGRLGDNIGSGSANLFGNSITTTDDAYVDWQVFSSGACGATTGAGQAVSSRLVLRSTSYTSDGTTVIATDPIYVTGTYSGENGNNDKFFANLKSAIAGKPGVYSVEIEADCGAANSFTGSRVTTWNYGSPTVSYEKGVVDNNGLTEINKFLGYIMVEDVSVYRTMVVFNGMYHDIKKFVPGNPNPPTSLANVPKSTADVYNTSIGLTAAPKLLGGTTTGNNAICRLGTIPTLPMGAEINIAKNGSGNVTASQMNYRVYKSGTTPPAYSSFNIPFKDGCPGGYNASTGVISTFPTGGSCWSGQTQNTNNANLDNSVTMQRWQIGQGVANILPTSFTAADDGQWIIEYYTETNTSAGVVTDTPQQTTFYVTASSSSGGACTDNVLPVSLLSFDAQPDGNNIVLKWQTGEELNNKRFDVERSSDVSFWKKIGEVAGAGNSKEKMVYSFIDESPLFKANYYRLKQIDFNGFYSYSPIKTATVFADGKIRVFPNPTSEILSITGIDEPSTVYVIDSRGVVVLKQDIASNTNISLGRLGTGNYVVQVKTANLTDNQTFKVMIQK